MVGAVYVIGSGSIAEYWVARPQWRDGPAYQCSALPSQHDGEEQDCQTPRGLSAYGSSCGTIGCAKSALLREHPANTLEAI
ncbi:hypothetical protein NDU88_004988 [Pleurodeles waltl]|uniref:Uncharacterized protein n=1 Tax=Pleurodeles waltl TaxID=8319 RepID=A0AAV7SKF2_PLEWA|nr:hypothetical protein NDU88_004988 [Pleurodeles waltl]